MIRIYDHYISKQSSIVNLRVLHPKLYCRRQKNLGIPYIPQKIGKFLGWTWRLTADEYKQKCTCRRIRRRTKANANLEISEWTKTSCTTVQLQIFSVFPLTNLEKSSKIDKKSAMQKLRVFTAISQNNCIALFNLSGYDLIDDIHFSAILSVFYITVFKAPMRYSFLYIV